MSLLIAGGTGFVGTELVRAFLPEYPITVLSRSREQVKKQFGEQVKACTWEELPRLDARNYQAVINLCGKNIAGSRWNEAVKQEIIDSRVNTNVTLINWLISQEAKPHFYCANAIGIYGIQKNDDPTAYDEDAPIDFAHPKDYLSKVGVLWQKSLQPATEYGIPVTITRFGVVLKRGEGMLKKLAPAFKLGLGSVLGDGKQVISWVHYQDVVRAYGFLLSNPGLTGAFNVTSPNPVSQAEFAERLAKALNRPLLLKTPAWVIRLIFGEMGDMLLLHGQRVVPKRLPREGFEFAYPELKDALAAEFNS
ncbi:TIGR01777 family oxidoreductase [Legionella londiniensis]|uniref:Nucleoside-diphosphate sugar epimerase n=1 Tax=Legionella londiniensis TaxID=45068 RepID=A0A0W0VKQ6_9GAMM|nr:TIGR01777 family oxidoreductase [Legionella londiniensis]KTD20689.1 nucleoside-diphosphate sugar epimerase [Legionella londiniensis]STX92838.1 nucleoside-diphosphate sugar epimerase [Legionella londiniensis]